MTPTSPAPSPSGTTRPVTEMLQERDWTGMSQGQIAKELGVTQQSVCSAIRTLAKRGIEVKYKKA